MISSWRHLTSLVQKWKTNADPVMTQHIKPSTPQVRDGAGTLESPPLMLKHKIVVYFLFSHKWSVIVCSEKPYRKKLITQDQSISSPDKSIYWLLHDTSSHQKSVANLL